MGNESLQIGKIYHITSGGKELLMLLQKFSQTFRVSAALLFAVLSTGILPTATAYASNGSSHGNPPGNNGFIKVNEEDVIDDIPNNDPQLSTCEVNVDFYNYDLDAEYFADVSFAMQSPTDNVTLAVSGEPRPFIGEDVAGGGDDLDAHETYTLSFEGAPAAQGYHVKVTVNADGSQGSDTKHKVFWMPASCGTAPATPEVAAVAQPCIQGDVTQDVIVNVTNTDDDTDETVEYTVTIGNQSQNITLEDGTDDNLTFEDLAAGDYTVNVSGDDGTSTSTTVTVEECATTPTPENPAVVAAAQPCVQGDTTTDVLVTVTNTDDDTDDAETYEVTINGETLTTDMIEDGEDGTVTFADLPVGTYDVEVVGSDQTTVSTTVTVELCKKGSPSVCPVSNNTFLAPWTYDGATQPFADAYPSGTPATYEFTADGLNLSTPNTESYVYGEISAGNNPLADIDAMSYKTLRLLTSTGNDQVVTAYILQVDLDGDTATTNDITYLFYEPLYNGTVLTGTWQTWDLINDGNSVWWSFALTGGNPTLTWSEILEQYPEAIAISYGFNQGTWNQGTDAVIQDLEFDCATTRFGAPQVLGDNDDKKETPVINVDQGAGQTQGGGQVLSASTALPATLPATGGEANPFLVIIASLIAYGAAYFLQGRRILGRNNAFSA